VNISINTSNTLRPVQIGLVGYGWWGKIIAKQIATSGHLKLLAIVEVDEGLRQQMASDPFLKDVQVLSSFDEFLKISELEAVILCTPHLQHANQIVQAAQAGKHVFCEKPLCNLQRCATRYPKLCATQAGFRYWPRA
jgi:predicted dehydrogenase